MHEITSLVGDDVARDRRAFELAFSTTYMFAGTRPEFLLVDEVTFQHPVDIGDLLRFRSSVVHTAQPVAPSTKVIPNHITYALHTSMHVA